HSASRSHPADRARLHTPKPISEDPAQKYSTINEPSVMKPRDSAAQCCGHRTNTVTRLYDYLNRSLVSAQSNFGHLAAPRSAYFLLGRPERLQPISCGFRLQGVQPNSVGTGITLPYHLPRKSFVE